MKRPSPHVFLGLLMFGFVSVPACRAFGQQGGAAAAAAANATGFSLPTVRGTLNYAVTASEAENFGSNGSGSNTQQTNFSGNLAYLSISQTHPFSVVYSGGYLVGTSNQPSSFFQNLAVSQVLKLSRWTLIGSDTVSYLPQTASGGLSGVPGTGDAGIAPIGSADGQGILTKSSARINNTASGSVQRGLTGKTAAHVLATQTLLRYTGTTSGGIDSTQNSFGGGLTHRLSARTTTSLNYFYSTYTYSGAVGIGAVGGSSAGTVSQSVNLGFTHQFTRKLSLLASAGPQRTSGSALLSPSVGLSATVSLSYSGRFSNYSVNYNSGSTGGSGVATGSDTQSVIVTGRTALGRSTGLSGNVGFNRSTGLPTALTPVAFSTNAVVASAQASRSLVRHLSGYVSYTIQRQSVQGAVTSNTLNGLTQTIAAGISYSPASLHLGHQ